MVLIYLFCYKKLKFTLFNIIIKIIILKNKMISLIALLAVFVSFQNVYSSDAVRLRDIQALTFRKNRITTYRRSLPMQQLTCSWGDCQYKDNVLNVQCVNMGVNDNQNVQWRCESQLPESLSLGKTTVSCEGYNHAGDEVVLKGSCGLKYELIKDYNYIQPINPYIQPINPYIQPINPYPNDTFIFLISCIIFGIICFTFCCSFSFSDSYISPYYGWFGRYHGGSTYYNRQPMYQTNMHTNVSYADTEVRGSTHTILSTLRQRPTNVAIQEPKVAKVSYADTEVRGEHVVKKIRTTKKRKKQISHMQILK